MKTNELDAAEARTIAGYNVDAEWSFRNEPPGSVGRDLRQSLDLAVPNPLILDVGCGYGRVIKYLQQASTFRYIGIDPATEMLKIARREHPEMDFREMNLYELPEKFPKGHFDLVLVITTLSNLPAERVPLALQAIRYALRDGGIGLVSFIVGAGTEYFLQGERKTRDYIGPAVALTGWRLRDMLYQLERAHFANEAVYEYGGGLYYSIVTRGAL